ncbi:S-layer homology domain-containing protein, partial [bacterium]|nr:S-layer homology domain-containing protein [bacterium]
MKVTTPLLGILLGLSVICPVLGAPIFPDAGENSWAQDAVATLAAKGLLEGYPDGTFKGDRSASRWEMAMIIARLLNQLEGQHVTLATKSELKQLQDLANNLRSELDALGARVNNLEEAVDSLESRVSNLERVSFYG